MKAPALVALFAYRVVAVADRATLETLLNEAGALGFGLAGVVQAHDGAGPLVILHQQNGAAVIEAEMPEQSAVSPVKLVPGNGAPTPRKGFRGY